MFTGIIQEVGVIERIESAGNRKYFSIKCSKLQDKLFIGASVACNGICLTVISFDSQEIKVEVMDETVKKTTVEDWKRGDAINLERALQMDSFLDGHLVQGHVDTVAEVIRTVKHKDSILLTISLDQKDQSLVVQKGSIAVNGVSLTVAELDARSFTVSLVGHTMDNTNLNNLNVRDKVNLEYDIIGKYVAKMLNLPNKQITEEYLREQGF